MLSEFPDLLRWEDSIRAIGHGNSSAMTPEQAVDCARLAKPQTAEGVADADPQGLITGMSVSVCPDVPSSEQAVTGKIRMANAESIAIDRMSDETGSIVCVHFPRTGYRVEVI